MPLSPSRPRHRPLGAYLVEDGVLQVADVARAVRRQQELADQGSPVLLGEVVLRMGMASLGQVQRALDRQRTDDSGP